MTPFALAGRTLDGMSKHRKPDAGNRIWSHPFRGWLAALVMISGAPMALLFATSRREEQRDQPDRERTGG
jgi:hypothetical protein